MLVGADAFTAVLTDRLRTSLGPALHAVYLIGSAAMGEFRPGGSDLDLLVVTNRHLYRAEKERLVEAVSHRSLPSPSRNLELVVYSLESLQSEPPTLDWDININTGPDLDDVSFDPSSEPRHWFVLDVAMAREHAEALWGPPSEEVFGPLDPPRVLEAMTESMAWHQRHDTDGSTGCSMPVEPGTTSRRAPGDRNQPRAAGPWNEHETRRWWRPLWPPGKGAAVHWTPTRSGTSWPGSRAASSRKDAELVQGES